MTLHELSQLRYLQREIELDKERVNPKTEERISECNRLKAYIAEIPDSLTRQIFTLRFTHGLSWRAVAYRTGNNTADSVRKICRRYLDKH